MEVSWFYLERGSRRGPVELTELLAFLLAAPDPRSVKVWREGLTDWNQAGSLPEISAKLPPPGPSLAAKVKGASSVTFAEAEAVARLYRRLVLLIAAQWLLWVLLGFVDEENLPPTGAVIILLVFACSIGVVIVLLVTTYRLMKHLGSAAPALWVLGMFVPLLNVFVLLRISSKAQAWCKRYGVKVGFFGPTKEGLERLRAGNP